METNSRAEDDEGGAVADPKLIPEWRVGADDQIALIGLAVVLIFALTFGWNVLRGDDDADLVEAAAPIIAAGDGLDGVDGVVPPIGGDDDAGAAGDADDDDDDVEAVAATTTTTAPDTTTTVEATTTTEATGPAIGDVQAAVDPFPGAIAGGLDGTVAVLTGFVANDAERLEAEAAAAAVQGVTAVDNQLVILEPPVSEAAQQAGAVAAEAVGEGTVLTVRGVIDSEDERAGVLAAAEEVEGVTEVIDALTLSVTADLNDLPRVQFATGSDEILPESFDELEAAAELLMAAGDITVEVQGYTDTDGSEESNLALSQDRADAVRLWLVDAGVSSSSLTAVGYGETTEFGPDLESNRLVRFEQIDG